VNSAMSLSTQRARRALRCLLLAALATLTACGDRGDVAQEGGEAVKTIEGSVIYRERMRLPPGAEVEVELQDISRADAPASTLATVLLPAADGPPYAFSMEYPGADIDPRHRYALRAAITVEGKLLFTSTDYIDPFAATPVEILVRRVPRDRSAGAGRAPASLEGTRWLLESVKGAAAGPGAGGHAADLFLDGDSQQVAGFSGCNRFSGSYRREGRATHGSPLSFGPLAGTRRACVEGMELEQTYLQVLASVDSFRLEDGKLSLVSAGEVVARFSPAAD
jgi:putative lipoprotein